MPAASAANAPALPAPPKQPCKSCGKQHQRDGYNRGRQPEHPGALAEHLRCRSEQRDQRRLVDIAEIRMPSADKEIKLVALSVIVASGRRVQDGDGKCDQPHRGLSQEHYPHRCYTETPRRSDGGGRASLAHRRLLLSKT